MLMYHCIYDIMIFLFWLMLSIEALEKIQDNVENFEDIGASTQEVDFMKDFFDNEALGALLEVSDLLG